MTACFFGDGAVAEGEVHEALNLTALWQVPASTRTRRQAMMTAQNKRGMRVTHTP